MEKYVPLEKMSKKLRRDRERARRGSWGAINPVTRKPPNPKAYDRKKLGGRGKPSSAEPFLSAC